MRLSIRMLVATALLIVGLAVVGSAQMMGDGHNHSSQMKADSESENDQMGKMKNMAKHCNMMASDFDNLEKHFDKMMKIDDIKTLKSEMKNHQEMMQAMQENMHKQENMCNQYMGMMNSNDSHCMMGMHNNMGMNNGNSDKTEESSHNH